MHCGDKGCIADESTVYHSNTAETKLILLLSFSIE
jgi:hypothetical protein